MWSNWKPFAWKKAIKIADIIPVKEGIILSISSISLLYKSIVIYYLCFSTDGHVTKRISCLNTTINNKSVYKNFEYGQYAEMIWVPITKQYPIYRNVTSHLTM